MRVAFVLDYYPDEIVTEIDATKQPIEVLGDIIGAVTKLPAYAEFAKETV